MANLDFARHVPGQLGEFVRSADQKAAFFLTAAGALLGWFIYLIYEPKMQGVSLCLAVIGLGLSGASAVAAILVVWPKQQALRHGPVAFEGIRGFEDASAYALTVSGLSNGGEQELAKHSYGLAEILYVKYGRLEWTVLLFVAAGVFALALVAAHLLGH